MAGGERRPGSRAPGGLTTKVLALVDALGNLARFVLLPGQRHDRIGVDPLLRSVFIDALIADQAFDNNALRRTFADRAPLAVSFQRPIDGSLAPAGRTPPCQDEGFAPKRATL